MLSIPFKRFVKRLCTALSFIRSKLDYEETLAGHVFRNKEEITQSHSDFSVTWEDWKKIGYNAHYYIATSSAREAGEDKQRRG